MLEHYKSWLRFGNLDPFVRFCGTETVNFKPNMHDTYMLITAKLEIVYQICVL